MATRSIVTSQPDVECAVCERRLLRGEQPDLFLDAGQPRMVCELCAPRAAHQGWKRGSAEHLASSAPLRTRRGRGLFERLRGTRPDAADQPDLPVDERAGYAPGGDVEPEPYDFLTVDSVAAAPDGAGDRPVAFDGTDQTAPAAVDASARPLHEALAVFNAGEYPRRVASLTRSLGAPEVSVRAGEAVASSIIIVVAWELCWYTYEVDLDDRSKIGQQGAQAQAIAQGTELSELGPQDRLANAAADERGALALI
ncbi:MAG TPA: hypothetical protein VHT25_06105 [Solirubrobacteraceae bacterium]|jgi:hypothetical protein|nr:hypothetical protein [Solirubrobacteraceae bacterium]